MWRGGCIIRSVFLGNIKEAYEMNPSLENLLMDDFFKVKFTIWKNYMTPKSYNKFLLFVDGFLEEIYCSKFIPLGCHSQMPGRLEKRYINSS